MSCIRSAASLTAAVYDGTCGIHSGTFSSVTATAALIMLVTAVPSTTSDSTSVGSSLGSSLATKTSSAVSAVDKTSSSISFGSEIAIATCVPFVITILGVIAFIISRRKLGSPSVDSDDK